jgi:hypothetical protein
VCWAEFFSIAADVFPEWELCDRSRVFVTTLSEPVDANSKYNIARILVMMIIDLFEWKTF